MNPNSRRLRNLAHRPAKPAEGRGRCQTAVQRLLSLSDSVTTAEAGEWTHARRMLLHGQRLLPGHYRTIRDAIRRAGGKAVGRGAGRGRPTVWRMPDRPR